MCEHVNVALGMACAADVDISYHVAVVAPVQRIGRLEFSEFGYCVRRHSHDLPLAHALAGSLSEPGPGNDDRIFLCCICGTIEVAVDSHAVSHLDGHILVAHNAGSALICSLLELGAEALSHSCHGIL